MFATDGVIRYDTPPLVAHILRVQNVFFTHSLNLWVNYSYARAYKKIVKICRATFVPKIIILWDVMSVNFYRFSEGSAAISS